MSLPYGLVLLTSSPRDDIDDREVDEGDCLGVSLGEPAAVEGADSAVEEVTVL